MVTVASHRLTGYIEYVTCDTGFVTPVFIDQQNQFVVQFKDGNEKFEWKLLPRLYFSGIILMKGQIKKVNINKIVYGFKWQKGLFFGNGEELIDFFTTVFFRDTEQGHELALEFMNDYLLD